MSDFFDENNLTKEPIVTEEVSKVDDYSLEKESYGKISYKEISSLRADATAICMSVPVLKYALTKPEKPRKSFVVLSIIAALLVAVVAVFAGYFVVTSLIPMINSAIKTTGELNNETLETVTLGLSTLFSGMTASFVWAVVVGIALMVVLVLSYVIYFLYAFIHMSKCSAQEMSYGHEVGTFIGHIVFMLTVSALLSALIIYGIATGGTVSEQVYIFIGVVGALLIVSISILTIILIERKKAKEIFSALPEEQQLDYKKHSDEIRRVKRRIRWINDKQEGVEKPKGKLGWLLSLLGHFATYRILYNNISEDEFARANSTLIGRKGLWRLLGFAIAVSFVVLLINALISSFATLKILLAILCIVGLVTAAPVTIIFLINCINMTSKQLKLNKKPIGYVNLILLIAIIVLGALAIIL